MNLDNPFYRAVVAFDVFQSNIWPEHTTAELEADVDFLRERYEARKWELVSFREAAYLAKVELLERAAEHGGAWSVAASARGRSEGGECFA